MIPQGKAHKPNVTHYQVCEQRPADSTLLEACLEQHVEQFGRALERVAADPGFFRKTPRLGIAIALLTDPWGTLY